jgi:hypothetical protein
MSMVELAPPYLMMELYFWSKINGHGGFVNGLMFFHLYILFSFSQFIGPLSLLVKFFTKQWLLGKGLWE